MSTSTMILHYILIILGIICIILLIVNVIIFGVHSIKLRSDHKVKEGYESLKLQLQKEHIEANYYRILAEQTEEQKILIHDIKKHLQTIEYFLGQEQVCEAREYIKKLMNSPEMKKGMRICDNPALNNILCHHMGICGKKEISFEVDVREGSMEFIEIEDMSCLFGNILDNAIEAAEKAANGFIELSICRPNRSQTLITLINSCPTKPVQKQNGEFISRKQDGKFHGLGIKSVKRIIRKYDGMFKAYYDEEDQTFHMAICLHKD